MSATIPDAGTPTTRDVTLEITDTADGQVCPVIYGKFKEACKLTHFDIVGGGTSIEMIVLVGEGPIDGIEYVWIDGNQVYPSPPAWVTSIVLRTGTLDQAPPGNITNATIAPMAWPGYAYISIKLDLTTAPITGGIPQVKVAGRGLQTWSPYSSETPPAYPTWWNQNPICALVDALYNIEYGCGTPTSLMSPLEAALFCDDIIDRMDVQPFGNAQWDTYVGGDYEREQSIVAPSDAIAVQITIYVTDHSCDGLTAGQIFELRSSKDGSALTAAAGKITQFGGVVWGQQGGKLVGTGATGAAWQGQAVAISADGNTIIVGGYSDDSNVGAAWVYTRDNSGVWTQQGSKLVASDAIGPSQQGVSVALSSDGNTAIVGGYADNSSVGAAWVWTRSGGTWTQQQKLVGTGAVGAAMQGVSVAISANGATAIVGGYVDNSDAGAAWVFVRSAGVWTQQGNKLVGTGAVRNATQGMSVAISADGNTAMIGGPNDGTAGAAWMWTRTGVVWSQQGSKLVGTGTEAYGYQGVSVALSADGTTAIVGGLNDDSNAGAAWVYTRSGGVWSQQGSKLVGTDAAGNAAEGVSVSISSDGSSAIVGGFRDDSQAGAVWMFTRRGSLWLQEGSKVVSTDAIGAAQQGWSVAISADGITAVVGGPSDDSNAGAAWVLVSSAAGAAINGAGTYVIKQWYGTDLQTITAASAITSGATYYVHVPVIAGLRWFLNTQFDAYVAGQAQAKTDGAWTNVNYDYVCLVSTASKRYQCELIVTDRTPIEDLATTLLTTCDGRWGLWDGKYRFTNDSNAKFVCTISDQESDNPDVLIVQDTLTCTRSSPEVSNMAIADYIDATDWMRKTVSAMWETVLAGQEQQREKRLSAVAVPSGDQLWRILSTWLARERRIWHATCDVPQHGIRLAPGDLVTLRSRMFSSAKTVIVDNVKDKTAGTFTLELIEYSLSDFNSEAYVPQPNVLTLTAV